MSPLVFRVAGVLRYTLAKGWVSLCTTTSQHQKAHERLTHKLFLPPFELCLSQGQTGIVHGTNWGSTV